MQHKNWWGRNWKWVVPVGIGLPILVCGGFVTLLFTLVTGLMKESGAYQDAVAAARSDTAVVSALGPPIEEGFLVTGNIEINGSGGHADLAIPLSGSRETATLYVVADKSGSTWAFDVMEVEVHGTGEIIDLLTLAETPY